MFRKFYIDFSVFIQLTIFLFYATRYLYKLSLSTRVDSSQGYKDYGSGVTSEPFTTHPPAYSVGLGTSNLERGNKVRTISRREERYLTETPRHSPKQSKKNQRRQQKTVLIPFLKRSLKKRIRRILHYKSLQPYQKWSIQGRKRNPSFSLGRTPTFYFHITYILFSHHLYFHIRTILLHPISPSFYKKDKNLVTKIKDFLKQEISVVFPENESKSKPNLVIVKYNISIKFTFKVRTLKSSLKVYKFYISVI